MERDLIRKILNIEGMTCSGCEMRIENRLQKISGVKNAKASFVSSTMEVTYDPETVSLEKIIAAIEKLDYAVKNRPNSAPNGEEEKSKDQIPVNQLIGICIILFAGYLLIKNTIGFNYIPAVSANMGYGILFAVGLMTSLHCIAMCGGINLSQCVSYRFGANNKIGKWRPSLLYNAGRVISYTIVGGIVGGLGSAVSFSGTAKGMVAILSGIFMVIIGLNMLNIFPRLRNLTPRLPRLFGNKIYAGDGKQGPFYIGLLNGLMPCGPLQAMQIYALATGSIAAGAASMFVFSLGTVPLMFGFGAASSFLSGRFTHKMMKVSAMLVMVLGFVMLNRGFALSGINLTDGILASTEDSGHVAKIEGNMQTVATKLQSGSYTPIIVQKGIPVKWVIEADDRAINGCNETIMIPNYSISKTLVPGDNEINFTPDTEGSIPYSCWMGMIRSSITVVADVSDLSAEDIRQGTGGSGTASGGCCGSRPAGGAGGCCK